MNICIKDMTCYYSKENLNQIFNLILMQRRNCFNITKNYFSVDFHIPLEEYYLLFVKNLLTHFNEIINLYIHNLQSCKTHVLICRLSTGIIF